VKARRKPAKVGRKGRKSRQGGRKGGKKGRTEDVRMLRYEYWRMKGHRRTEGREAGEGYWRKIGGREGRKDVKEGKEGRKGRERRREGGMKERRPVVGGGVDMGGRESLSE
jgi:transcription termination factor Rho